MILTTIETKYSEKSLKISKGY